MHKEMVMYGLCVLCVLLLCHTAIGADVHCPQNKFKEECNNVGTCVSGKCICKRGYSGDACTENTFANCLRFCSGHGICVEDFSVDSWKCQCDVGYESEDCHVYSGCGGDMHFCSGHGQCHDNSCLCELGWTGSDCGTELQCIRGCSGHGTCKLASDGSNAVVCECDPNFTGNDCSQVVLPSTCTFGCSGHGTCRLPAADPVADYPSFTREQCICQTGYAGPACNVVRNPCAMSCGHGNCVANNPAASFMKIGFNTTRSISRAYSCACDELYSGPNCNTRDVAILQCNKLALCSGHGTCTTDVAGIELCECTEGYEGETCSHINPFAPPCPGSCSGHGTCDLNARADSSSNAPLYLCNCQDGWEGAACDVNRCSLEKTNNMGDSLVCSGHGVCELSRAISRYRCNCDDGYQGQICSAQIQTCSSSCTLHGKCVNGECICDQDWKGPSCTESAVPDVTIIGGNSTTSTGSSSTTTADSNAVVCCPYECSDNGTCDMAACKCVCKSDWAGLGCETFAAGGDVVLVELV
eukprot:c466_g1_i1.p1 GENE.c466_g1_i1~~c466_g1_i1.p1  ORF type:complete len:526 (+),score=108.88 c466_g1_i1:32-1609(+)